MVHILCLCYNMEQHRRSKSMVPTCWYCWGGHILAHIPCTPMHVQILCYQSWCFGFDIVGRNWTHMPCYDRVHWVFVLFHLSVIQKYWCPNPQWHQSHIKIYTILTEPTWHAARVLGFLIYYPIALSDPNLSECRQITCSWTLNKACMYRYNLSSSTIHGCWYTIVDRQGHTETTHHMMCKHFCCLRMHSPIYFYVQHCCWVNHMHNNNTNQARGGICPPAANNK